MTDVELLPLPEWTKRDDLGGLVPSEVRAEMQAYARANVEHHTAALQAEVDALRGVLGRILENEAPNWKFREEFGGYVLDDELREEARAALAQEDRNG